MKSALKWLLLAAAISSIQATPAGPNRRDSCEKSDIASVKAQVSHKVYFCNYYVGHARTGSPFPDLSGPQVANACQCIKDNTDAPTKQRFSPQPTDAAFGPGCTCRPSDIADVRSEFVNAKAFCNWFVANGASVNQPQTPVFDLQGERIASACQCILKDYKSSGSSCKATSTTGSKATTKVTTTTKLPVTSKSTTTTRTTSGVSPTTKRNPTSTITTKPITTKSSTATNPSTTTSTRSASTTPRVTSTSPTTSTTTTQTTSTKGPTTPSTSAASTSATSSTTAGTTSTTLSTTTSTSSTTTSTTTSTSTSTTSATTSTTTSTTTTTTTSACTAASTAFALRVTAQGQSFDGQYIALNYQSSTIYAGYAASVSFSGATTFYVDSNCHLVITGGSADSFPLRAFASSTPGMFFYSTSNPPSNGYGICSLSASSPATLSCKDNSGTVYAPYMGQNGNLYWWSQNQGSYFTAVTMEAITA